MGNKKNPMHPRRLQVRSPTKKKRYFKDKVRALAEADTEWPPSSPRVSPPTSPASSDSTYLVGNTILQEILQNLNSKEDMASMLSKLENSMQERLSAITLEVRQIGLQVGDLEGDRDNLQLSLHNLEQRQDAHKSKLVQIMCHTEDLNNRGRRNNLRVRGIPEAQGDQEDIRDTLQNLFNKILQRATDTPILLDRAHRAVRPQGLPQDTPRDIICRVHYYTLKEVILRLSRNSQVLNQSPTRRVVRSQ
ncbi:Hypothetical predicted protein [Pelobates cultripes]|uniref:Transposase n=1 Tax=Pelobates cultripes TaxID=61616 RepID=A0AAD1S6G5_PELCU|nr:Hypothetical predicted protein [Pelobates cultripes]